MKKKILLSVNTTQAKIDKISEVYILKRLLIQKASKFSIFHTLTLLAAGEIEEFAE